MKVLLCVQGSDVWWTAKRGVPSASSFDRILTAKTAKPSAAQDDYIAELCADIACLTPNYFSEHGISRPMQNGHDTEPEARRFYELETGRDIQQVGFVMTDDDRFGCSPDGLIRGENRGLELKCPNLKTHAAYALEPGRLVNDYRVQVHGCLRVTGYQAWDLMSYAPGVGPVIVTVRPDAYTLALDCALDTFWMKYQMAIDKLGLREKYELIRAERLALFNGRQAGDEPGF